VLSIFVAPILGYDTKKKGKSRKVKKEFSTEYNKTRSKIGVEN
jgi:hypothetical protein